jgi:hypothetical protein
MNLQLLFETTYYDKPQNDIDKIVDFLKGKVEKAISEKKNIHNLDITSEVFSLIKDEKLFENNKIERIKFSYFYNNKYVKNSLYRGYAVNKEKDGTLLIYINGDNVENDKHQVFDTIRHELIHTLDYMKTGLKDRRFKNAKMKLESNQRKNKTSSDVSHMIDYFLDPAEFNEKINHLAFLAREKHTGNIFKNYKEMFYELYGKYISGYGLDHLMWRTLLNKGYGDTKDAYKMYVDLYKMFVKRIAREKILFQNYGNIIEGGINAK